MQVNVKYGITTESKFVDNDTTVGQLKRDASLKAILGFKDNVRALLHGQELGDDTVVPEGATIVIEDRCNEKALVTTVTS